MKTILKHLIIEFSIIAIMQMFYFFGLINDRFICKGNKADDLSQKKAERIDLNRNN